MGQTPISLGFVRDLVLFSGGHLKVFHYYEHAAAVDLLRPRIFFTPTSRLDETNPWLAAGHPRLSSFAESDAYFLAGMDWAIVDSFGADLEGKPVINLIQGLSHADPADEKFAFLRREALRICVSDAIAGALEATDQVKGPIVVITNAIDLAALSRLRTSQKRCAVFISGTKNPGTACAIAAILAGKGVPVQTSLDLVPRHEFLAGIAASQVAVVLPLAEEGFFLPALEAMALAVPVVVPDCVGNRSFCISGQNCIIPSYDAHSIAHAVLELLRDPDGSMRLVQSALATAQDHCLEIERARFAEAVGCYLRGSNRAQ